MTKTNKTHLIPLIIFISSLWTLFNTLYHYYDIFSWMSIAVGIVGIVLYFGNNKKCSKFFYLWAAMQIPDIEYAGYDMMSSFPLSFGFGIGLTLKNNQILDLYFNVLPIGLCLLFKYLLNGKSQDVELTKVSK